MPFKQHLHSFFQIKYLYYIRASTIDSLDSSVNVVCSLEKMNISGIGFEIYLLSVASGPLWRPSTSLAKI
jgi:hypothetical protein